MSNFSPTYTPNPPERELNLNNFLKVQIYNFLACIFLDCCQLSPSSPFYDSQFQNILLYISFCGCECILKKNETILSRWRSFGESSWGREKNERNFSICFECSGECSGAQKFVFCLLLAGPRVEISCQNALFGEWVFFYPLNEILHKMTQIRKLLFSD